MVRFTPTALACALIAAPLAAQQPSDSSPQTDDEIVVTGELPETETINRYIAAVIREEPAGQYARFDARICPSVIGFSETTGGAIEQRMRLVAEAGGVELAKQDCNPNLHFLVVDDAASAIAELRAKHGRAFGRMTPYQRDRLQDEAGRVVSWYSIEELSSDNGGSRTRVGTGLNSDISRTGGVYGILTNDKLNTGRTHQKSRVVTPVRQSIQHSFVLIERDAVLGKSPTQLADFALLRGLVRAKSNATQEHEVTTIFSLFDEEQPLDEAPLSLTLWDLALLKSLYSAPPDMRALHQRNRMAVTFQKVLAEGE